MPSVDFQPFPNTHWSMVRRAAGMTGNAPAGANADSSGTDAEARREAFAILLARYEPALRSYLRVVRRMAPHDADDLLQAFIADKLLGYELLRRADEKKGRFRTLLLTSLNRFAISQRRHEAVRRADGVMPEAPEDPDAVHPSAAVDAAWARALVHDVLQAMKRECDDTGRPDIWLVFEGRVLAEVFGNGDPIAYEDLAQQLNLTSPTQAANLLVTAKRMYARQLRLAVAEYEADPENIEVEIADLRQMLAAGTEK